MNDETYDRLVGLIYEAAVDPSRWADFVRELEECLGGGHLILSIGPAGAWAQIVPRSRLHPAYPERYADVADLDPFHRARRPLLAGTVEWADDVIDAADMQRSPYYNEYWAPLGYAAGGTVGAFVEPEPATGFGVLRPRGVDALPSHTMPLLERLMPHLRRAVTVHGRMAHLGAERLALGECLDRFSQAVILLDSRGRIRLTNRPADTLLRRGDALRGTREGVEARDPQAGRALHRAIVGAVRPVGLSDGPEPLRLPRANGGRPLEVLVVPLRLEDPGVPGEAPRVALFVSDPGQALETPDALLARLYGLTPAESALARKIAEGMGPAEAADQLGITSGTARTRLKIVLAKTDTRRQGALVRLLSAGLAQLRPEPGGSSTPLDNA